MTTLFLFAHQDDEFGVFWKIQSLRQQGQRVAVAYLTAGTFSGEPSPIRDQESIRVLGLIGVPINDINFVGNRAGIPDGHLPEYLQIAFDHCVELAYEIGNISEICCLAWEGGHQDHDAVHLIGVQLAKKLDVFDQSCQFPLYNGAGLRGVFFRLFSPLPSNGAVFITKIPIKARLRFATLPFYYRSQWRTWCGLYPFMLLHYIFSAKQYLQKLSVERIKSTVHSGQLLYERRGFYSAQMFAYYAKKFIANV